MFKYILLCSTILLTTSVQAAEDTSKATLLFSYEPELVMFHELIKQHRDETVACFGKPKKGELYYGAQVESSSISSASLYFYVPLSVIAKKKEGETITIQDTLEFTVAAAPGHTLEDLIEGLKKRFADRPEVKHSFDPSTQEDLTEEQLKKMSEGDAAKRRIILRLAQVERETGAPCVIL